MNILLIHAVSEECEAYRSFAPPLGLLYLAAVLEKHGHTVEVIDCEQEQNHLEAIHTTLCSLQPSFVGISTLTPTFGAAVTIAQFIKSINSRYSIILGGIHATFFPEKILRKYSCVDYVIIGEGEETLPELVAGASPEDIAGLAYRDAGEIRVNSRRALIQDLDQIPFPARHLTAKYSYSFNTRMFSLRNCAKAFFTKNQSFASIVTSRGCPVKCRYCANSAFHSGEIRFRSAENVLQEVEQLARAGYSKLVFFDDHFTSKAERVRQICLGLRELRKQYNIRWMCMGRVESASDELYKLMAEAGCMQILVGIENGSPRVLEYYNKKLDLEKVRNAIRIAKKYDIDVIASIMLGAPVEELEDVRQTSRFLNSIDVDFLEMSKLAILPGTPLWTEAVSRGYICEDVHWENIVFSHDVLPGVSADRIRSWAKYISRRYYLRPSFVARQLPRYMRRIAKVIGQ